jgi:hypothetical protein
VIPTSAVQEVCELELKSYQSCKTFELVRTGNLFLGTMCRVERNYFTDPVRSGVTRPTCIEDVTVSNP